MAILNWACRHELPDAIFVEAAEFSGATLRNDSWTFWRIDLRT